MEVHSNQVMLPPIRVPLVLDNALERWCLEQIHLFKPYAFSDQGSSQVIMLATLINVELCLQQEVHLVLDLGNFLFLLLLGFLEMLNVKAASDWLHVVFRENRAVLVPLVEVATVIRSYAVFIIGVSIWPLFEVKGMHEDLRFKEGLKFNPVCKDLQNVLIKQIGGYVVILKLDNIVYNQTNSSNLIILECILDYIRVVKP